MTVNAEKCRLMHVIATQYTAIAIGRDEAIKQLKEILDSDSAYDMLLAMLMESVLTASRTREMDEHYGKLIGKQAKRAERRNRELAELRLENKQLGFRLAQANRDK